MVLLVPARSEHGGREQRRRRRAWCIGANAVHQLTVGQHTMRRPVVQRIVPMELCSQPSAIRPIRMKQQAAAGGAGGTAPTLQQSSGGP